MNAIISLVAFVVRSLCAAAPHPNTKITRLAGNVAEADARIEAAKQRDQARTFGHPDANLCAEQRQQAREGYVTVQLVDSIYGYTVRYASGLQGRAIMFSDYEAKGRICDNAEAMQASFFRVAKKAIEWANEDLTHRDVICYAETAKKVGLI